MRRIDGIIAWTGGIVGVDWRYCGGGICIRQFLAFPEAFQELVDRGFSDTSGFSDFPAAHSIGETKNEHSLVVHTRTSLIMDSLPEGKVFPL